MTWKMLSESDEVLNDRKAYQAHMNLLMDNISEERSENFTESGINLMVNHVLSSSRSRDIDSDGNSSRVENLKTFLSDWQISELDRVKDSESGIRCLLNSWLVIQKDLAEGTYCNATWDNVYCWPPTPLGSTVNRTCLEAFTETQPLYAPHLQGHGYRVCQANGTWLWGGWTNYTECADSYDALVDAAEKHVGESELVTTVQYILFIGSILSLICLSSAVTIFYYFRVLWCDRVTIHLHLMAALMLRYIMLFVITEPFVLKRTTHYRSVDMVCKGVLIVYLYATLTSINWMFIQGIYINGKLTTNVFNGRTPFKVYYTIGWLLPFVLMTIWATIMHFNHDVHCWSGYAEMNEIWIIICPIIFALIVNFLFLINILRIMLTKVHTPGPNSDALQFRRAAKATIFLFPLLGINNLLFLYNPGGDLHKYFVILNTLFGSTQGIFVAIVYCYLSKDVRAALRRVYRRFMARRNANLIRRRANPRNAGCTASSGLIIEQPVNSRMNGRRVTQSIRTSQLSPTNCYDSYNSNQNSSRSHSSNNPRPSQISNSPSQNTLCREMMFGQSSTPANLPVSPSRYSGMSASSYSSCRLCAGVNNNSVEFTRVHSSYRNSAGSSLLVSPEHPWSSSNGVVAAAQVLGSRPQRKNIFCRVSIPLRELNER